MEPLPDHLPECNQPEGRCADDCPRYDAEMAAAQWGQPHLAGLTEAHPMPPQHYPDEHDPEGWTGYFPMAALESTRSSEMLGLVLLTGGMSGFWLVAGLLIGWWLG